MHKLNICITVIIPAQYICLLVIYQLYMIYNPQLIENIYNTVVIPTEWLAVLFTSQYMSLMVCYYMKHLCVLPIQ